jgi:hypothetical protein
MQVDFKIQCARPVGIPLSPKFIPRARAESRRLKARVLTLPVGDDKGWLPGMDSNHDSRLQRPLSYH